MALFEVGKRYNFTTIAPVTLGQTYNNVKAIANVDFNIAIKFSDVISIREAIIQETSAELLNPRDVLYTMFETMDGKTVVLANDWIVPSSIIAIDQVDAIFTIRNITNEDAINIKNMIAALGYKVDVELKSTLTQ